MTTMVLTTIKQQIRNQTSTDPGSCFIQNKHCLFASKDTAADGLTLASEDILGILL